MMKVPYYGNSSGSASGSAGYGYTYRLVSSSITNNAYACGTQGSKGWTTVLTSNYSGDNACYACKPNACPTGYSAGRTSVADCGTGGAANWEFYIANNATYGEEICSKCVRKTTTCPSGYTAGLTNVSKCGSSGAKGWTVKTQGNCGKCEAKECTQGLSYKIPYFTVTEFIPYSRNMSFIMHTGGGGLQYLNFTPNGYYTGDTECGSFALDLNIFCDDYRREIKKCVDEEYSYGIENTSECMNNVNDRWAKAYDDVNMCNLCIGVFGSVSDLFFCEQENLTPGINWGNH